MKTVIVTGASRGIGAALCRNLRTKGVRVIGVARTEQPLVMMSMEKIGVGPMEHIVGDVTDVLIAKRAIELATKDGKTLDGLVLNAASLGPVDTLANTDINAIRETMELNVFSVMNWIQEALPHLRHSKGRIIVTSSGVATMPLAGFTSYCGSKAMVNSMIGTLALEEPNITALSVAPGVVDTEMLKDWCEKGRRFMSEQETAAMDSMWKRGMIQKPEIVAEEFAKLVLAAPADKSGKFIHWNDQWVQELKL